MEYGVYVILGERGKELEREFDFERLVAIQRMFSIGQLVAKAASCRVGGGLASGGGGGVVGGEVEGGREGMIRRRAMTRLWRPITPRMTSGGAHIAHASHLVRAL